MSEIPALLERLTMLEARVADLEAFRRAVLDSPSSPIIQWKDGERWRIVNGVKVYRDYAAYIDD